jgi:hypothetical protein
MAIKKIDFFCVYMILTMLPYSDDIKAKLFSCLKPYQLLAFEVFGDELKDEAARIEDDMLPPSPPMFLRYVGGVADYNREFEQYIVGDWRNGIESPIFDAVQVSEEVLQSLNMINIIMLARLRYDDRRAAYVAWFRENDFLGTLGNDLSSEVLKFICP